RAIDDLWALTRSNPSIDAATLARSVEDAAADARDFRTRLLIRDSVRAIRSHWGKALTDEWLEHSTRRAEIRIICDEINREADEDEHGFPSLMRRIVDATDPDTISQFFRALSHHVEKPIK